MANPNSSPEEAERSWGKRKTNESNRTPLRGARQYTSPPPEKRLGEAV
ncbi:MAG: hypothetical protein ACJ0K4_04145 [Verrucomicrobiales bacterium]